MDTQEPGCSICGPHIPFSDSHLMMGVPESDPKGLILSDSFLSPFAQCRRKWYPVQVVNRRGHILECRGL